MTDELESQIRAAMAGSSSEGDTDDAPAPDTGGESSGGDDVPTGGTPAADATGETDSPKAERSRDERGRFAQGAKATGKTVAPKLTPKPSSPVGGTVPNAGEAGEVPASPKWKAPQSWKPEHREKWGALDPALQEEIDRREREISKGLQDSSQLRGFQQEWHRTLSPYEAMLRAHGQNPMEAVGNALQSVWQLHNGPPAARAKAIAALIDQSGVPLELINASWTGQAPQQQDGGWGGMDPQSFAQQVTQQVIQSIQAQNMDSMRQKAARDIDDFAAKNEFFEDVRAEIGALVTSRGLDLQQAYEAACWANPDIRKILMQREAAAQAKAATASTQRSRAAASSVRTNPTAAPEPTAGDDLDSQIRAAMKAVGRR